MGADTVKSFDEEVFQLGGCRKNSDFFVERKDNTITVEAVKEAYDPLLDFITHEPYHKIIWHKRSYCH